SGRQAKVGKLQTRMRMICRRYGEILDDDASADDEKFVLLQNELVNHIEKCKNPIAHHARQRRRQRQQSDCLFIRPIGALMATLQHFVTIGDMLFLK
ncbi:MAG: hypothetical protein GY792_14565, partial [Gammaproteobacteria bacterium]|nr:hypothetical protein [Gammaproteobacteria bacterium]